MPYTKVVLTPTRDFSILAVAVGANPGQEQASKLWYFVTIDGSIHSIEQKASELRILPRLGCLEHIALGAEGRSAHATSHSVTDRTLHREITQMIKCACKV